MDSHNTTPAQTMVPSRTIAFSAKFYIITTSSRSDVIWIRRWGAVLYRYLPIYMRRRRPLSIIYRNAYTTPGKRSVGDGFPSACKLLGCRRKLYARRSLRFGGGGFGDWAGRRRPYIIYNAVVEVIPRCSPGRISRPRPNKLIRKFIPP